MAQVILDYSTKGNLVRFHLGEADLFKKSNYDKYKFLMLSKTVPVEVTFPFDLNVFDVLKYSVSLTKLDLIEQKLPCVIVSKASTLKEAERDPRAKVYYLGQQYNHLLFKLTVDNITNLDYAHFLGFHAKKCKSTHAHGSCKVSVTVTGWHDGVWVVDFGEVKRIIKEIIEKLDHKLIVKDSYVTKRSSERIQIKYKTSQGDHMLELPSQEVFVFNNEPTLENILYFIATESLKQLPPNIVSIEVEAQEGQGGTAKLEVKRG